MLHSFEGSRREFGDLRVYGIGGARRDDLVVDGILVAVAGDGSPLPSISAPPSTRASDLQIRHPAPGPGQLDLPVRPTAERLLGPQARYPVQPNLQLPCTHF